MAKRDDRADMATVIDMARKSRKNGIKRGQGPAIRVAQEPLAWACWDTPDRVAVRPDIRNETGEKLARLLVMSFADGALKIAATRRPHTLIHAAAGAARLRHTWVKSVLVSEPRQGVERACETLSKRLGLAGCRNVGGRLFEATPVEAAAAILRDLYPDMQALPPEPVEHVIPMFLRKETPMFNEAPVQSAGLPSLVVANTAIRQDREGRYCLNDLHKAAVASGANQRTKEPGKFLASPQTIELVKELETIQIPGGSLTDTQNLGIGPVNTIKGGLQQGTYVCKELVYAYAMWISAKFHLTVIRAFDALVTGQKPDIGGHGLPQICEEACDARAWFLFNQVRESAQGLLGSAAREGDDERLLDGMFWVKTRIQERLRKLAKRQLASRSDPQAVAAWILAWTPDRPALA